MSKIDKSLISLLGEEAKQNCSFCGIEKSTAMWSGSTNVFVCHKCAIEILPNFIADAIYNRHTRFSDCLDKIEKNFYYAMANNLDVDLKRVLRGENKL
ncbi:MAG TPA: hypothetical protein DD381_06985 [Lentisphaeria bacterium]|nr:MAG: hypothetical protein A2X47_10925 [Lentisphaerae bacterium GWF2_38_69]HBM16068.1 hypothetical protein [Lentisphaeria bacterium]